VGNARAAAEIAGETESSALTAAVVETFLGLLVDSDLHPDRNAVDVYAAALKWSPLSREMATLLNAERGYSGTLAGTTVTLGSDGTNDIWALSVGTGFEPVHIVEAMGRTLTLERVGSDRSLGQATEIYRAKDGTNLLGLVVLTYGADESVAGTGTVAFMSAARAAQEGIGQ
jgi:hypothetical protein